MEKDSAAMPERRGESAGRPLCAVGGAGPPEGRQLCRPLLCLREGERRAWCGAALSASAGARWLLESHLEMLAKALSRPFFLPDCR